MNPTFETLLHRFGPQAQDRQLHIARAHPDITESGWDVDLVGGRLKFRDGGRDVPVQVLGSEAGGQWMWGHDLPGMPDALVQASQVLIPAGDKYGIRAFQVAGFDLPEWRPGQLLSGMSCAVIVAGLVDAPGIFCCHDRHNDRRLWIAMMDDALREPEGISPLERIVLRYPQILAMAGQHPHRGGITLVDWVLGLDGYCRSHGVDGDMDGDDVILSHGGRTARATFSSEGLSIIYEM